jgi:hypothetical protein
MNGTTAVNAQAISEHEKHNVWRNYRINSISKALQQRSDLARIGN